MNKKTIITKMSALKGAISNLYGKIEEIQNKIRLRSHTSK